MRRRKTKGEYSGAETVYLNDVGKIIIPLAPIRAAGFDVDGVFADLLSRDHIERSPHFYFSKHRFDEPGRLEQVGAFNGYDLLDEFLSYALAGKDAAALHIVVGHA